MVYLTEYSKDLGSTVYYIEEDHIKYIDLKSNYKIRELYSSDEYKPKIIKLLTYKFDKEISTAILKCLDENYNKTDMEIYNILHGLNLSQHMRIVNRGSARIKKIEQFINLETISPTNYLDVGCFTGDITSAISRLFKLDCSDAFGIDIKNYIKSSVSPKFTFKEYNGLNIPFTDNSFDLITIFMVLHHVSDNNIELFVSDVARVLKPGGVIIIREHGLNPLIQNNTYLLDVVHSYYDNVLSDKQKWNGLFDIEINNYNTIPYWIKQFNKYDIVLDESNKNLDVISNIVDFEENLLGNVIISLKKQS